MAADPSIGRAGSVEQPRLELEARAAGALCDRNHRRVYAFCLAQLRNADEAADATQTTFVHALAALQRGVEPTFELGWLLAIARNVCRSRWEARRRRRHLEVVTDPQDLAELASAHEPSDRLEGIDDALARLPELQRRAVVLRDWQGLTYKEIAAELGVTLAAAETLIFRGRSALAQELSADEAPQRRSGLGSLLGLLKSGVLGGGSAAKVAVGAVAVLGLGAAGAHELARPAATPATPRVVAAASPAQARLAALPAVAARPAAAVGRPQRRVGAHRAPAKVRPIGRTTRSPTTSAHRPPSTTRSPQRPPRPTTPPRAGTPPPGTPGDAPATPAATSPPTMPAAAPPRATSPAPAGATAPVAAPAPSAAAAAGPVTDATTPVATTATNTVQPVVTTATDAVQPVVTTATNTLQPVVTTVTDTTQPVVTTVTSALPPLPAPPPAHLP